MLIDWLVNYWLNETLKDVNEVTEFNEEYCKEPDEDGNDTDKYKYKGSSAEEGDDRDKTTELEIGFKYPQDTKALANKIGR